MTSSQGVTSDGIGGVVGASVIYNVVKEQDIARGGQDLASRTGMFKFRNDLLYALPAVRMTNEHRAQPLGIMVG